MAIRRYYVDSGAKYGTIFKIVYEAIKKHQPISSVDLYKVIQESVEFKESGCTEDWIKRGISELLRSNEKPINGDRIILSDGSRVIESLRVTGPLPDVISINSEASERKRKSPDVKVSGRVGTKTSTETKTGAIITAIYEEMTTSGIPSYEDSNSIRLAIENAIKVPGYGISGVLSTMITAKNGPLKADYIGKTWRNIRLRHANVQLPERLYLDEVPDEHPSPPAPKKDVPVPKNTDKLPTHPVVKLDAPRQQTIRGGDADFVARVVEHFLLDHEKKDFILNLLARLSKEEFFATWQEATKARM